MAGPEPLSFSFTGPDVGVFLLSSFPFTSLSLVEWCSEMVFLAKRSEGDCGWFNGGVRGPFSGGGDGGRPFRELWLDLGLGWWAEEEPLVGVDVLL